MTDAASQSGLPGLGYQILQEDDNGVLHAIAYGHTGGCQKRLKFGLRNFLHTVAASL